MNRVVMSAFAAAGLLALRTAAGSAWNESAADGRGQPSTRAQLEARVARLLPGFTGLDEGTDGGQARCRIIGPNGLPSPTVNVADVGDRAYFLEYLSDGELDRTVAFVVLPNFEGSPLAGQAQVFTTNDITNISTPFGVPSWGLDLTAGPWLLIVRKDLGGQAVCPFEVVA
jgi:hypothetical protein